MLNGTNNAQLIVTFLYSIFFSLSFPLCLCVYNQLRMNWPKNFMACIYLLLLLLLFNNTQRMNNNASIYVFIAAWHDISSNQWNSKQKKSWKFLCVVKIQQSVVKLFDAISFTFWNVFFLPFFSWVLWFLIIKLGCKDLYDCELIVSECLLLSYMLQILILEYISLNKSSQNECI